MPKLSDTQLVLLSNAAQRPDHAVEAPTTPPDAALKRAVGQLIRRGFLQETAAQPGMPVWRHDEAAGPMALVITEAGLEAIGIDPAELGDAEGDPATPKPDGAVGLAGALTPAPLRDEQCGADLQAATPGEQIGSASSGATGGPRAGSKLSSVMGLLRRDGGASITDLTNATGWLPHTTRAALTGLRKRGYAIEKLRGSDGKTAYSLAARGREA
jgi:hypothetical protein